MNKFHNLRSITLLPWSGASLIAQLVKSPPAMQETVVWFLGWEDLGRSPGEGIGYPLQYSWAYLVAQLEENLPAMWETWVGKISWRRERLPTLVFWPGEFHGLYSPRGRKESDATEWLSLSNKIPNFQVFGVESVVLKKYVKFTRALTKLDWEGEAF